MAGFPGAHRQLREPEDAALLPRADRHFRVRAWGRALCSALYLFAAFRSLLDSRDLWRSVHPLKILRSGSFWTAALLVVIVEAVVIWSATSSSELTANRFLGHTLYSGITQPGSFYLAHVLFYAVFLRRRDA